MKSFDILPKTLHAFRSAEAKTVANILLREGILLSLGTLAILLTLEGLLPGTVSLRIGVLFFILVISIALFAKYALSREHSVLSTKKTRNIPPKIRKLILGFSILWVAFLLGNSLIGFHLAFIATTLAITMPLLKIFLDMENDRQ